MSVLRYACDALGQRQGGLEDGMPGLFDTAAGGGDASAIAARPRVSERLERFLAGSPLCSPFLAIDRAGVRAQYAALADALPGCAIYYAVKANPLPAVVGALAHAGASFDIASEAELEDCLAAGIPPHRLSFGNTIKTPRAIARAHRAGVRLFTIDCQEELAKVAAHAPGACVFVRLATDGRGAEWPLSRKFGCDAATACDLMVRARALGLATGGVSFHVGSQQTDPGQWDAPIAVAAAIFASVRRRGIELTCLNVGGGFPARYRTTVAPIREYGAAILDAVRRHFGPVIPRLMAEPGRYLVAEAGVLRTCVVLVAERTVGCPRRWVYLDCGRFGGLAETAGEAIKYPVRAVGCTGRPVRVALAGPTCDSADVLYERTPCFLPEDLAAGDVVDILSAGAYTYTYSSVGFNGFGPLTALAV
jgi:ornithine decarboxylase